MLETTGTEMGLLCIVLNLIGSPTIPLSTIQTLFL